MNEIITVTKQELVEAMRLYNEDSLENPQNFRDITSSENCAEDQVDYLLDKIDEHHQNEVRCEIISTSIDGFIKFCKEKDLKIPDEFYEEFLEA